jgi:hypothetical protein
VADVAEELVTALPALEKAIELAVPLEGAIERIGRLVDRLPAPKAQRRAASASASASAASRRGDPPDVS